jgi:peptidoglycan/LPS O-acetylase OafA/YrhL
MIRVPKTARKWLIGLLGILVATALVAIRTPDMLSERIGIILPFGVTCAVLSLIRRNWLLLAIGSVGGLLFLLGMTGSDSGGDGEQFAGFMFLLAGLFLLMAATTAIAGNWLFREREPN